MNPVVKKLTPDFSRPRQLEPEPGKADSNPEDSFRELDVYRKDLIMTRDTVPAWYNYMKQNHPQFINAVEELGTIVRQEGPLDQKTGHLIQLAAAAAIRSEGAVHSHVRRALEAGATKDEIYHALVMLTSTVGFPTVAAGLKWAEDILGQKQS